MLVTNFLNIVKTQLASIRSFGWIVGGDWCGVAGGSGPARWHLAGDMAAGAAPPGLGARYGVRRLRRWKEGHRRRLAHGRPRSHRYRETDRPQSQMCHRKYCCVELHFAVWTLCFGNIYWPQWLDESRNTLSLNDFAQVDILLQYELMVVCSRFVQSLVTANQVIVPRRPYRRRCCVAWCHGCRAGLRRGSTSPQQGSVSACNNRAHSPTSSTSKS